MKPKSAILVLQHADCEPPGAYQDELDVRGVATLTVELDRGESLPSWEAFDALIVMGGPMSANDEASFGWLASEKSLIRDFVEAERPFWGVCLGAQLLAASLGARVYTGLAPEVGVLAVDMERGGALDAVFSTLPRRFSTLQWHSDTFDLPEGSVLLASSPSYRHQAFRWGRAYGLQFHLEASPELVREWGDIPVYAEALEVVRGTGAFPRLVSELVQEQEAMRSNALALFRRWLDLDVVVRPPAAMEGVKP